MPAYTFSVVMPTYNRADCILQGIQSVLAQPADLSTEIIVVDDSTDDTGRVIESFVRERRISNITYIKNPTRAGIPKSRNAGIEAATGDLIVILDSDDELLPESLRTPYEFLQSHPDVAIYFGAIQPRSGKPPRINKSLVGKTLGYREYLTCDKPGEYLPICRASVLRELGLRFEERVFGFEGMLWTRILRSGHLAYMSAEPIRLYDDMRDDRLTKATVGADKRIAANHARGFTMFLTEFGEDLSHGSRKMFDQYLTKIIVYQKIAAAENAVVTEFIEKNLGAAGLLPRLLYASPASLSLAAFKAFQAGIRLGVL